jgi:hypothetical protein
MPFPGLRGRYCHLILEAGPAFFREVQDGILPCLVLEPEARHIRRCVNNFVLPVIARVKLDLDTETVSGWLVFLAMAEPDRLFSVSRLSGC